MALDRDLPSGSTPTSGADYMDDSRDENAGLWNRSRDILDNVSGINNITADARVPITVYAEPMRFLFVPVSTNTGPMTIDIDGIGVKDLVDASGDPLDAGRVVAGRAHLIDLVGTEFRILSIDGLAGITTKVVEVAHHRTNNTAGGTATAGSYQTYPLNTLVRNDLSGDGAGLSSNQITLPAGTYDVIAVVPFSDTGNSRIRLRNVTDGEYIEGLTATVRADTDGDQTPAVLVGRFVLAATKVLELHYRVQDTQTTTGLGVAANFSETERYGFVRFIVNTGIPATGVSGGRELLTSNRTYYVRTDGDDGNDGLVNNAGGAWATIQHAYDWICGNIDFGGFEVTIQLGNGTHGPPIGSPSVLYTERTWTGGGSLVFLGDRTTPANVVIDPAVASGWGFFFNGPAAGLIKIYGVKIQNSLSSAWGAGIFPNTSGITIWIGDIDFGAWTGGTHMWVAQPSTIFCFDEDYTISGGALYHVYTEVGGIVDIELGTITLTGTPAFTTFARVLIGATFYSAVTYSGAATGKRFEASENGVIWVANPSFVEQGIDHLPGNTDGTLTDASTYNDIPGIFSAVAWMAAGFSSPNITMDALNGRQLSFTRTMAGNETLAVPTNLPDGGTIRVAIAVGANTLSFASGYEGAGNALPVVTGDTLLTIVRHGARYYVSALSNLGDGV